MAVRVFSRLAHLLDVPAPVQGQALGWGPGGAPANLPIASTLAGLSDVPAPENGKVLGWAGGVPANLSLTAFKVIDVTQAPYNAVGDGVANDRAAIQAALDAGAGLPIVVYLPQGTYKVYPPYKVDGQYPGYDCLTINYNNVVLMGAGPRLTTITCFPAGGTNPATTWEVLNSGGTPTVWRGRGIVLKYVNDFYNPLHDIHIADLRLTGNSSGFYPLFQFYPGPAFPADPVTGANWDLSNQAIMLGNGGAINDVYITNCEVDSFRAELFYYGGAGMRDVYITDCRIHDSIGSAISVGGRVHVRGCELYGSYNAVENTPNIAGGLNMLQDFRFNHVHDNVIGIVITANVDASGLGLCRVLIENNRINHNYRGSVWVRGGIAGVAIKNNDLVDSGQGTDANVFIASAYGFGPKDITVEGNTFRAETTFVGMSARVSQDPGYPVKNIRFWNNRFERSQYVRDNSGTFSGIKTVLYDATSTVFIDNNDFSGCGGPGVQVGDSYGVADAAVPYLGKRNKWTEYDMAIAHDFVGIATNGPTLRPNHILLTVTPQNAGYMTVTSMGTTGIQQGHECWIRVNAAADRGVYFPATGTGWAFRRPYWIPGGGTAWLGVKLVSAGGLRWEENAAMFNGNGISHHMDALHFLFDFTPNPLLPVESNYFWLSGVTADTVQPNIPFHWAKQVDLAPTAPHTYTTFSDAPPGEVVTVKCNANVTVQQSATIKLVGGTSFAPGGTGGVITFVMPKGTNVLYEVSRFGF